MWACKLQGSNETHVDLQELDVVTGERVKIKHDLIQAIIQLCSR